LTYLAVSHINMAGERHGCVFHESQGILQRTRRVVKLAQYPGDLAQPGALPGIIDVRICLGVCCGSFNVTPEKLAEKIDRSFQVLPQTGVQQVVHYGVLMAGAGALEAFPLQL
jgi:hypothetical protein